MQDKRGGNRKNDKAEYTGGLYSEKIVGNKYKDLS